MKVLHWYPNFLGGGGVANAVLGLARAQAEVGAEVAIASAEVEGAPLYQDMKQSLGNVRLFRWLPEWSLRAGRLVWRKIPKDAAGAIKEFKPDIVHVHGEFNPDNWHVPRIFDVPIVLSPHGAFHPVALRKSKSFQKNVYIVLAKRFLYRHVSLFHALCPAEAEHIGRALNVRNIYTLPQGPSVHVLSAIKERMIYGDDHDEVRFLFVGRLDIYTKGLDILIEAFAEVLQRLNGEARLVLVGPDQGGSLERLRDMALEAGCAERVDFVGAVAGEKVAEFMSKSDVYVHLSRHDVFGLSIAEALCLGKPVILSNRVGIVSYPEITSLPHVKVIPPEKEAAVQAMVDFARQIGELRVVGMSCREDIQRFFDWKRIAEEHLTTYENCIKGA